NQTYKWTLAQALSNQADILATSKQWRRGAETFAKAAELTGGYWIYLFQRALMQLAAGDEAGYRTTCTELVKLNGETSDPYHAFILALTCVVGERAVDDMTKVIALARKATQADPRNPAHWIALGAAQYSAGQTR